MGAGHPGRTQGKVGLWPGDNVRPGQGRVGVRMITNAAVGRRGLLSQSWYQRGSPGEKPEKVGRGHITEGLQPGEEFAAALQERSLWLEDGAVEHEAGQLASGKEGAG